MPLHFQKTEVQNFYLCYFINNKLVSKKTWIWLKLATLLRQKEEKDEGEKGWDCVEVRWFALYPEFWFQLQFSSCKTAKTFFKIAVLLWKIKFLKKIQQDESCPVKAKQLTKYELPTSVKCSGSQRCRKLHLKVLWRTTGFCFSAPDAQFTWGWLVAV